MTTREEEKIRFISLILISVKISVLKPLISMLLQVNLSRDELLFFVFCFFGLITQSKRGQREKLYEVNIDSHFTWTIRFKSTKLPKNIEILQQIWWITNCKITTEAGLISVLKLWCNACTLYKILSNCRIPYRKQGHISRQLPVLLC